MAVAVRQAQRAPARARLKVCEAQIKTRGLRKATQGGGEQGVFEALVSVFGNVDTYGERVLQGAFARTLSEWETKGHPIPVIWAHEWNNPEAHIGEVMKAEEREAGLWVQAQVDLGEPLADKVWRLMTKRRVTNFSFAYDVIAAEDSEETIDDPFWGESPVIDLVELKLYEVGPCLVGVNQQTELLATKGLRFATPLVAAKGPVGSHSTDVVDEEWDAGAVERNVRSDEDASYYRRIYAWQDPDGDVGVKSTWKFPHHRVSEGGEPGPAVVRALTSGIGILNGGRGGANIPDADRQGVYNHLARHLRDDDRDVPELRSRHAGKEGRRNSAADQQRLGSILEHAHTIVDMVEGMLDSGDVEEDTRGAAAPGTATGVPRSPSPFPRRNSLLTRLRASGIPLSGGNGNGSHRGAAPARQGDRRSR